MTPSHEQPKTGDGSASLAAAHGSVTYTEAFARWLQTPAEPFMNMEINWMKIDLRTEKPGKRRNMAAWREARLARLKWAVRSGRGSQRKLLRLHQLQYDMENAGSPNNRIA